MKERPWMNTYLHKYYDNGAWRLRKMVNRILYSKRFRGYHQQAGGILDFRDFYSVADEVFVDVLDTYNPERNFDGYLYSSLYKAFIDELKKQKRKKRTNYKIKHHNGEAESVVMHDISIDEPLPGTEDCFVTDVISNGYNLEDDFMNEEEIYTPKVEQYLNSLSVKQRKVAVLIMRGCSTREIRQRLQITEKEYLDCMDGLRAYTNIRILF